MYVSRPDQVVRRVVRARHEMGEGQVSLPSDAKLIIERGDVTAGGILRSSIQELDVLEAMWLLTGKTPLAVDVGSNVGYFTSLLL